MTKEERLKIMVTPGLTPVIRLDSGDKVPYLLEALAAGGIRTAELTMTMPDAPEILRKNRSRFAGTMLLGMGTVTNPDMAEKSLDAGADFLVSPFPVFDVLKEAQKAEIPMIMGAFSPYEVFQVSQAGADFVKVFPLNVLGLGYLKDLKGPLPYVKFFPTGGITLENIPELFKIGVAGCGVGGALVRKDLIEAEDWSALTALTKKFIAAIPQKAAK